MSTHEKPVIFSADMVNAILAGNKTQTRRVVKPQPIEVPVTLEGHSGVTLFRPKKDNAMQGVHESWLKQGRLHHWKCKYGKIGDKLWVRETWSYEPPDELWVKDIDHLIYRADYNHPKELNHDEYPTWKPSIHMPRWASRILLEITDIRVERLNDITVSDAIAEGYDGSYQSPVDPSIKWYADLWEQINGEGSWSQNQFVWVISFKRV